jgi:hypothetical protein
MKIYKSLFILLVICLFCGGCNKKMKSKVSEKDLDHLRASITYIQESFKKEESFSKNNKFEGVMKDDVFKSIVKLRKLALEEAEKIEPESLAIFDRGMPAQFKNSYLLGLKQWNEGIEKEDYDLANKGLFLINDWGAYYTRVLRSR